jgi:NTP pyrophosphatase (non-canonical NTP hydrolase)
MGYRTTDIYEDLTALTKTLHEAQASKGFWDGTWPLEGMPSLSTIEQKLLLIVGEVAEAHEELRTNPDPLYVYFRDTDGKPEGFGFELADVFIRLADLAAAIGLNLGELVAEKHEFNKTRPHKHGRQF